MENKENIAGLGKNHDKAAHEHDIAKKQSEAKPAVENLDMYPNSINKDGSKDFLYKKDDQISEIPKKAKNYTDKEHKNRKRYR